MSDEDDKRLAVLRQCIADDLSEIFEDQAFLLRLFDAAKADNARLFAEAAELREEVDNVRADSLNDMLKCKAWADRATAAEARASALAQRVERLEAALKAVMAAVGTSTEAHMLCRNALASSTTTGLQTGESK